VTHPPVAPDSPLPFAVRPGVMTLSDLSHYRAVDRAPTDASYRGYDVYGMGPPSSGGSTVAEALNILEGFDLTGERELALHRFLEASRLAFADRNRWIGDPDQVAVPLAGLLSKEFAAQRRCLIGATALVTPVEPGDPNPPYRGCSSMAGAAGLSDEGASTNHSTVADRFANVVSYTSSLGDLGGSVIAVPGYGFLLNDHLNEFDPLPISPTQPDPDLPAAGKRPRSSAAPTIVVRDGRPFLATGSLGGPAIITTVLEIVLNRIDFKMSLPRAIAAPRASQQNTASSEAEPAFIAANPQPTSRFGQSFSPADFDFIGAATGIEVLSRGRLEAVAEPTRLGGGDAEVVCPNGHPPRGVPRRLCAAVR
jgi:gamma-glutamyltranspeptidase / glutathione hydrolase